MIKTSCLYIAYVVLTSYCLIPFNQCVCPVNQLSCQRCSLISFNGTHCTYYCPSFKMLSTEVDYSAYSTTIKGLSLWSWLGVWSLGFDLFRVRRVARDRVRVGVGLGFGPLCDPNVLFIFVLRIISGPRLKFVQWKAFNRPPPSGSVYYWPFYGGGPDVVLILHSSVVYTMRRFVFSLALLFVYVIICHFSISITLLGEEGAGLCAYRAFVC